MMNPLHLPVRTGQHSGYSALSGALIDHGPLIKRLPPPTSLNGSTRHSPITFEVVGSRKKGVKMHYLTPRDCSGILDGGTDIVFVNGQQRINFRIMWPGYSELWIRSIDVLSPRPITRARLGSVISENFKRFLDRNRLTPCALSEWSLHSGKIRFENLILVSLVNTFEDSWQADVLIEFR